MFCKIILLILCLVCFSGCEQNLEYAPQKIFKSDSDYFIGLQKLKENNYSQAERFFYRCIKKGSLYCKKRSYEELLKLSNVQERQKLCEKLIKEFNDEESLLIAVKEFYEAKEYTKVINLTEKIDIANAEPELVSFRLKALNQKQSKSFSKELWIWYSKNIITSEHNKIYNLFIKNFVPLDEEESKDDEQYVEYFSLPREEQLALKFISFRNDVFRRDYKTAYKKGLELYKEKIEFFEYPFVISDFGKSCLYGNIDYLKNAKIFEDLSKLTQDNLCLFYSNFYAGRMYEKAGEYFTLANNSFIKAMKAAPSENNYDNALWCLLDINLKKSVDSAISVIKKYCNTWHNPSYFDDFFEVLSPLLISQHKWNEFYTVYKMIDGYASDAVVSKFAYIYGRLLEEGYAIPSVTDLHKSEATAAFTRALTSGTDVYYRVMALSKVGYGGETAEEVLCQSVVDNSFEINEDAEKLLLGYAAFGFPEKIYPEWKKFSLQDIKISIETSSKLSNFLKECGKEKPEYFSQSLRIISNDIKRANVPLTKDELKLVYPQDFSSIVEHYSKEYKVLPEIMYALIRTESFFDASIESAAGAIGLTQLMVPTASDIARKLKKQNYSLLNPEDNIQFGTYYLAELIRRLDNQILPAFFSYNAGITRVRRWLKSSKIQFSNVEELPIDLFLETVPYDETRNYGRYLIASASMYGWLYYDKNVYEIVNEIIK